MTMQVVRIFGADADGNEVPLIVGASVQSGVEGVADNDAIYTSGDVSSYNAHYISCTAGIIDVDVSIDGTNYIAAVACRNIVSTTPSTFVVEAAAGVCLELRGNYAKIRINQKGATASNATIRHANV